MDKVFRSGEKIKISWFGKTYDCKVRHIWKNANALLGDGFGISVTVVKRKNR